MFDRIRKSTFGTSPGGNGGRGGGTSPAVSGPAPGSPASFSFTSKVGGFVTGLGRSLVPKVREGYEYEGDIGGRGGMGGSRFDLFFGRDDEDLPSVPTSSGGTGGSSGVTAAPPPGPAPSQSPSPGGLAVKGGGAASAAVMLEERYVDVVLQEPTHMEFEHVFGRLVLTRVGGLPSSPPGAAGGNSSSSSSPPPRVLMDVAAGSVLIAVDGEALSVENYDRLTDKVKGWTDAAVAAAAEARGLLMEEEAAAAATAGEGQEGDEEGISEGADQGTMAGGAVAAANQEEDGHLMAAAITSSAEEEGEKHQQQEKEEEEEEAVLSPPPPLVVVEASSHENGSKEEEMEGWDPPPPPPPPSSSSFPALPPAPLPSPPPSPQHKTLRLTFRLMRPGQDPEEVFPILPPPPPHEQQQSPHSLSLSSKILAEQKEAEAQKELCNSMRAAVAQPQLSERLAEHFLAMNGRDLHKAAEQFKAIREEARELLAAHENDEGGQGHVSSTTGVDGAGGGHSSDSNNNDPFGETVSSSSPPPSSSPLSSTLCWDPEEEGPEAEQFPTFEASNSGSNGGGGSTTPSNGSSSSSNDPSRPPAAGGRASSSSGGGGEEFEVVITEQQRLGITVENVLERTVICTVARTSCAFRAGVEEGCLVVGLNEMNTRSMCHKEVIDRLQQPHRPLRMRLRRVAPEKLEQRRNEMIALMHPHGMVASGGDNSLESRSATVTWAEQRLLLLVRLLAVGATIEGGEKGGAFYEGPAHVRLLNVLASIQAGFKKREEKMPGVNDRLRAMGVELSSLVDLFEDVDWGERGGKGGVLAAARWHFIDMVCQVLSIDSESSLTVANTAKGGDLTEGPAIVMLQEMVRRLRGSQVRDNINLLLYRLAGSYSMHARVACCALIPLVYGRMPLPQQLQVRGILTRFMTAAEEGQALPILRSVVIQTLSDLTPFVDIHSIKWLFFMLETSSGKDSPHRTRNKVLEICYRVALALRRASELHSNQQAVAQELHLMRCKLLPFVNIAAEDADWQVRAAFAFFCPGFVDCFGEHWATVFIDNLESLMRDPEVNVRRLAVDSIPRIAENWLLAPPSVPARSSTGGGGGAGRSSPSTVVVVGDVDEEVRAARVASRVRVLDHLVPGMMRVVMDPAIEVRMAGAVATGKLLKLLARGRDEASNETLEKKVMTPLLQRLLHDDSPVDVAMAMLEGMRMDEDMLRGDGDPQSPPLLLPLLDSQLDLLLPAIESLASQHAWRLRKAVVECLPTVQVMVLPGHRLDGAMQALWARLLTDPVEVVRRCSAEYLCLAGRLLGAIGQQQGAGGGSGSSSWAAERVLPRCQECMASPSFKQRQLALHMAQTLVASQCFTKDVLQADVVPLLVAGAADRLANVRLVVPAVLELVASQLAEAGLSGEGSPIKSLVITLINDTDRDVRYYARRAHTALGYGPPPLPLATITSTTTTGLQQQQQQEVDVSASEGAAAPSSSSLVTQQQAVEEEEEGGEGALPPPPPPRPPPPPHEPPSPASSGVAVVSGGPGEEEEEGVVTSSSSSSSAAAGEGGGEVVTTNMTMKPPLSSVVVQGAPPPPPPQEEEEAPPPPPPAVEVEELVP